MKLYGTKTSPFVRRIRIAAAEIGEPAELIDTTTDDGQARLRAATPIWKVPVAEIDGRTLFDSRTIADWLITTRGWGNLAPPRDRWRQLNLVNAIDGALESSIQAFYLKRDKVSEGGDIFSKRQLDRTTSVLSWLETQVASDGTSFGDGFGWAEVSVICALDWMDFRAMVPTDRHPALIALRKAWLDRGSVATTRPSA